jgi:hypothetical protein
VDKAAGVAKFVGDLSYRADLFTQPSNPSGGYENARLGLFLSLGARVSGEAHHLMVD